MKGPNGKAIKVEYEYEESDSDEGKDAFGCLEIREKDIAKAQPPKQAQPKEVTMEKAK